MKIKRLCLSIMATVCVATASAGDILSAKESARWADGLVDALIQNFWGASFKETPDRYYFNKKSDQADLGTGDYWPQAHAIDVITDAYLRTGKKKYFRLYDLWCLVKNLYNQCAAHARNTNRIDLARRQNL